jgi:uncharacterized protein Usg
MSFSQLKSEIKMLKHLLNYSYYDFPEHKFNELTENQQLQAIKIFQEVRWPSRDSYLSALGIYETTTSSKIRTALLPDILFQYLFAFECVCPYYQNGERASSQSTDKYITHPHYVTNPNWCQCRAILRPIPTLKGLLEHVKDLKIHFDEYFPIDPGWSQYDIDHKIPALHEFINTWEVKLQSYIDDLRTQQEPIKFGAMTYAQVVKS